MKMLFYLFHKQSEHTCNYTERCKNILNEWYQESASYIRDFTVLLVLQPAYIPTNHVNTMAVHALVPPIARSSAAMILTVHDR